MERAHRLEGEAQRDPRRQAEGWARPRQLSQAKRTSLGLLHLV